MKRSRSSHVRLKIVALLAALAALWGFAAFVTVREGLNVLFVETVANEVGLPANLVVGALQQERRVSVVALTGDPAARAQLEAVRAGTDGVIAAWHEQTDSRSLRLAASDQLKERIADADAELAALDQLRLDVDTGTAEQSDVLAGYTAMIESGFSVYTALSSIDDTEIARQSRTLVTLSRARELLSRQDALVAGALAEGEFREPEIAELTQLVGAQRFVYTSVASDLSPEQVELYEAAINAPAVVALRETEDQLVAQVRPESPPPISAAEWEATLGPAMGTILEMEIASAGLTLERADEARTWVIVRLVLAGGLGLIAVVAAVIISITTARSLIRQLERLRDAARDLARYRLPRVVDRLSAGETVDVAAEAPPLRFGSDEIGQVGQAFNAVQETAVRAAVQQAELRHGIRDVFLSLARRTQNLVHKQLSVLDGMERRETDADEMEEIYRVDHLATRMRRNAENLIVLSGASPGRTWRRPVAMIDVVRGAVAEVEDYTRVGLLPVEAAALEGRAVGDVIHLLAELIENAASFSPPYAKVSVGGQRVAHGFVIEIEDRGLGMSESELTAANAKLANPPDFSLADASRLGHYVVAKLAQRHAIRVHLRTSPYGGIVAIVLVPNTILAPTTDGAGAVPTTPTRRSGGGGPDAAVAPATVGSDGAAAPTGSDVPPHGGNGPNGPNGPGRPNRPTGQYDPEGTGGQPPGFPLVRQRQATLAPPIVAPTSGHSGHEARHRHDHQVPPIDLTSAGPATAAAVGSAPAPPTASSAPPAAPPGTPTSPSQSQSRESVESRESGGGAAAPAERRTPSGLPWRVRQASLPKQLGDGNGATAEPAVEELPDRDPEQVRLMMRAYQHGTRRGRNDGPPGPMAGPGSAPGQPGRERSGRDLSGRDLSGHDLSGLDHPTTDLPRTSPDRPVDQPER